MYTVGLVEDEIALKNILEAYLSKEGINVLSCENTSQFKTISKDKVDIWVVDIMLPDGNGFEILKEIKFINKDIPIILMSARGESIDRVIGFEMGCDDYIAKPFLPKELVFRVKKILDRVHTTDKHSEDIIKISNYDIDTKKRTISVDNTIINLTAREYDLVIYFIKNRAMALSREKIIDVIWEENYFGSDRVVDSYIKKIRKKLPLLNIETIYGYGYRCNI